MSNEKMLAHWCFSRSAVLCGDDGRWSIDVRFSPLFVPWSDFPVLVSGLIPFPISRARRVLQLQLDSCSQPGLGLVTGHGCPADGGGPGHGGPGAGQAGAARGRVGGGVVPGGGPSAGHGTGTVGLDGGGAGPHAPNNKIHL